MLELPGCPPIRFVKRRNQRNLRIRVKSDAVIVSAPLRCSERQMADFLRERQDWVRQTSARLRDKQLERSEILTQNRGYVLLHGRWIPLVARPPRPASTEWLLVWRTDRVDVYPPESEASPVIIPAVKPVDDSPTDRDLIVVPAEVLAAWVKSEARERLPVEFQALAETLSFNWSRIFVRSQKTKWGTCSSRGNISLNWRLIKCPDEIRRYIMIHELCHTVHMNHSKAFWNLVAEHYPDYRKAHRWLREQEELLFQDGNAA